MCKFFSFIQTPNGDFKHFDAEQRADIENPDSHTTIIHDLVGEGMDDLCGKYEVFGIVDGNPVWGDFQEPSEMLRDASAWFAKFSRTNKFKEILKQARKTIEFFSIDELLKDDDAEVRKACAPFASSEQLEVLIKDYYCFVRKACVPFASKEQLEVLVKDEDWLVRAACVPRANPEQLVVLINDNHWLVRETCVPSANPEQLAVLVKDEAGHVREASKKRLAELG